MPDIDSWFAKYRSRICAIVVLFTLVSKIKSMVLLLPLTAGQTSKASPHVNGFAFLPYRTMVVIRASCSRKSSASLSTPRWSSTTTALIFLCSPLFVVSQSFDEGYNGSYPQLGPGLIAPGVDVISLY